jgi:hypothetical protein
MKYFPQSSGSDRYFLSIESATVPLSIERNQAVVFALEMMPRASDSSLQASQTDHLLDWLHW